MFGVPLSECGGADMRTARLYGVQIETPAACCAAGDGDYRGSAELEAVPSFERVHYAHRRINPTFQAPNLLFFPFDQIFCEDVRQLIGNEHDDDKIDQ